MKRGIFLSLIVLIILFVGYHFWLKYQETILINRFTVRPSPITRQLPSKDHQKTIRILAISGGGIYGIIPAHVLSYLEKATGKPISESFDLMMGTSTGSIPVVLLTTPDKNGKPHFTAQQILDFYNEDSKKVFYNPWYHRLLTLDGLIGPKYLTKSRRELMQNMVGTVYFDQLLNNVVIPAYGLYQRSPLLFYNWQIPRGKNENFQVGDLLLGAISPPAIFPTVIISSATSYALTDGAIFSNNPSLAALITAMSIYPNKHYLLVSLGTGEAMPIINPKSAENWGMMQWIIKLLPTVVDSTGKFTNMLLNKIERNSNPSVEYHYFNIPVSPIDDEIDNIEPWNVKRINQYGNDLVNQSKAELNALANQLNNP